MNRVAGFPYLLENDRVNRWYYRDAPPVGAVVMFTHETYIDQVERVTLTHVWLVSGRPLLRPHIWRRIVRWSINRIRNRNQSKRSYAASKTTWIASEVRPYGSASPVSTV